MPQAKKPQITTMPNVNIWKPPPSTNAAMAQSSAFPQSNSNNSINTSSGAGGGTDGIADTQ